MFVFAVDESTPMHLIYCWIESHTQSLTIDYNRARWRSSPSAEGPWLRSRRQLHPGQTLEHLGRPTFLLRRSEFVVVCGVLLAALRCRGMGKLCNRRESIVNAMEEVSATISRHDNIGHLARSSPSVLGNRPYDMCGQDWTRPRATEDP